ncbi:MAG: hypothetical protein QOH14_3537, partial [Pseudonocardiales bacterium]|nr:hypothetical protein [Pseudonocardiales bacterium]
TLTYPGGSGHNTPTERTGAVAVGATIYIGDTFVKHLTTLTITVEDSTAGHPSVSDATVVLTDTTTNTTVGTLTAGPYTFNNLDPDHTFTIHASKTHAAVFPTSTSSGPTTTIPGFTEGKTVTGLTFHPGTDGFTIRMTNPET